MIYTGGGMFDPDDRPIYFLAGSPEQAHRRYHLTAVNDAMTEMGEREGIYAPIEYGSRLLLDSGIFNLTNRHKRAHGTTMDQALKLPPEDIDGFDKLYSRYVELVKRYESRLWGYIELDQGGVEGKRRTRALLHEEGLNPIPVYHPLNDGWDYFDELAEQYDRICFGNVVQAPANVRIRLLHTMWQRRRRYPHLWIHVLGWTLNSACLSVPPDSCDSSTWTSGLRWDNLAIDSSYLNERVVGRLPPEFRYNRAVARLADGGWMQAAKMYATEYDRRTTIWRDLIQRRAELGFDPWPTPSQGEEPPCPRTP